MRSYSPNLKPEQLRNHGDAAERLGVPRSNILDLRVLRTQAEASTTPSQPAVVKLSWWQRRHARRVAAKQLAKQLAAERTQPRQAAVVAQPTTTAVPLVTTVGEAATVEPTPANSMQSVEQLAPAVVPVVVESTAADPVPMNEPEIVRVEAAAALPATTNLITASATATETELVTEPAAVVVSAPEPVVEVEDLFAELAEPTFLPTTVPEPATIPEAAKLAPPPRPALPRRGKIRYRWQWRPVAAFAVVSAVCIITPLGTLALLQKVSTARNDIEDISQEATKQLSQAASASGEFDFTDAITSFDSAATNFRDAHDQLISINEALTPILRALPNTGNQFSSAENILIAGEQLAGAGADLATAFGVLEQYTKQSAIASSSTDLLVTAHSAFRPAVPRLERAALALSEVDLDTVPPEYRDEIVAAQTAVPVVVQSLDELLSLSETMLVVLGHDEPKRYLVVFQNNREMRATGGFIGSFAVVDIYQGKVSAIEIPGGGPYDLAGALKEKVISPQPLHLVNAGWQLQDANWWPDFPTSAEKIQWFYRKSGGSSVDGVITLTPDVIEQMLAITGPIDMPEYAATVTAENFYDITQTEAERKYDDTRESKKFIADLTPKLLNKLFALDLHNFVPVLQTVYTALAEKDILLYFNDVFLENELAQRGWTGEVKTTAGDYLMVVDTNIGGGKTDAAITETIEHEAAIQADGSVIDTVTITRSHTGASGDVFTDVKNLDYLRVYVPAGSTLLSATGFEQPDPDLFLEVADGYKSDTDLTTISGASIIDEASQTRLNQEFGKTVFGNWLQTEPGGTSKAVLQYRLPFQVKPQGLFQPAARYSLLVQKQAGAFDPLVITNVTYPTDYSVLWSYPNVTGTLHQALQSDRFTGLVFE